MPADSEWSYFERSGWEAKADPYTGFFGPLAEQVARVVLDRLAVGPSTVFLDVCCGQGTFAGRAASLGARAYGIDVAGSMVSMAARSFPGAEFRRGDATELPWPDDYFDAVVCNFGIHHISDSAAALRQFARVTRPGGRVAFSVWDDEKSGLMVVPMAIYEGKPAIPAGIPSPPPEIDYADPDVSRASLGAAGLDLDEIHEVAFTASYPHASALWDGWLAAAIRTAPILDAQTPQFQHAARARFESAARALTEADGTVTVPIVVNVVFASRPNSTRAGQ